MQSLISGAECATTSNPLSQVLKHTEGDRSLQRDRVEGPSSSRLRHLPPSTVGPTNTADIAMARQFFDSSPGTSLFQAPVPVASRQLMESLHNAPYMPGVRTANHDPSVWAMKMHISSGTASSEWSEEFGHIPMGNSMTHLIDSKLAVNGPFNVNEYPRMSPPFYQPSFSSLSSASLAMNWDQEFSRVDTKGKGKATDIDFEAAFTRAAASVIKENPRIVEVQDDTASLESAFEQTQLSDSTEKAEDVEGIDYLTDFQKVWDRLKNSDIPPPDDELAKWEAEYNQIRQAQRDEFEFGEDIENAWQSGLGNFDKDFEPAKFNEEGVPILEPYKFEPNNPYLGEQTSNLARAKRLLNENGSLTDAALFLEAAIQQGELGEGGHETWILLGETRSMDEREDAAMRALSEGVRRAQDTGTGEGMLSLAISYTNESFDRASYGTLYRWLLTKFSSIVPQEFKGSLPSSPWASHDHVTNAFLAVARQQHLQGIMDPEVQIGLGVLFYTKAEFDKAKDCFGSALAARPKDYLLWNRLGSCLSNGSKPEEALGAYREALQIRPTYTRAIYNVGVACLNIGTYKEAAEHFLSALMMQESVGGDKSEQLWQTLRKCFVSMNRDDLADAAKPGQSLNRFKQEGFDF